MPKKLVFITGGGTGGHIYPAVAIYDELSKFLSKENIFYVGNPKNLEKKVAEQHGIKFLDVYVAGMPRKFTFKFISWVFKLFVSILVSIYYILKWKFKKKYLLQFLC